MRGVIRLFLGLATADLEMMFSGAVDTLPGEAKKGMEGFFAMAIGWLALGGFILLGLYVQAQVFSDIFDANIEPYAITTWGALVTLGIFAAGFIGTYTRQRQNPTKSYWNRFFGLYLMLGAAAMAAWLVGVILKWPYSQAYLLTALAGLGLLIWGWRTGIDQQQVQAALDRFEQGEIGREEAAQQLEAAGLKAEPRRDKLDRIVQLQIVNRYLDRDIDLAATRDLLREAGVARLDLDSFLDKWTQNRIMLRYVRGQIDRDTAREMFQAFSGASGAKADEWLTGIDRLLASEARRGRGG